MRIVVRGTEDLSGEVALTAEAPDFISWRFSPRTVELAPGSSAEANLTLSSAGWGPVGEYEVLVLARSGEVCSQTVVPVAIGELNVSATVESPHPRVGEPTSLEIVVSPVGPPPEFASLRVSSDCADLTPDSAVGPLPLRVNVSAEADRAGECAIEATATAGGVSWSTTVVVGFVPAARYELAAVSAPPSLRLGEGLIIRGVVSPPPGRSADIEVTLRGPGGMERTSLHGGSVDPEGRFEFSEDLDVPGEWRVSISLISPETGERVHLGTLEIFVTPLSPDLTVVVGSEASSRPGALNISLAVLESTGRLSSPVRVSVYDETARVLVFSGSLSVENGSSERMFIEYEPAEPGTHVISAIVDPGNDISESDEENNEARLQVDVPVPSQPGPTGQTAAPPAGPGGERGVLVPAILAAAGLAVGGAALAARRRSRAPAAGIDPCEELRVELRGLDQRIRNAAPRVPPWAEDGVYDERERLRAEREELEGEIQRLRNSTEELKNERESLRREASEARERLGALNRRLREMDILQGRRDRSAQGLERAKERLRESIENVRKRVEGKSEGLRRGFRYRGLSRRVRAEEERLRRAAERLGERPESRSRRRAVKRAEARLAQARERLRAYEQSIEEKVREMERRLLNSSTIRSRRREVERMEERLRRAEERVSAYRRRHSGELEERARLEGELEGIRSRLAEVEREIGEGESKLADLERRLRELDEREAELEGIEEARSALERLRREREEVQGRLDDCVKRVQRARAEEAERRRECEAELQKLVGEVQASRSDLEGRLLAIERGVSEVRSGVDSADGDLRDGVEEWRDSFSSLLDALREVSDVLKLAGADIDPSRFSGLWDWGNGLLGALGSAAGYAIEDLASTPLPTDLVKAVGGMYSIMSSLLNPLTAGGSGLLLAAGGPEQWAEIQRAFRGFRSELKQAGEDPSKVRSAREGIESARSCLDGVESCLGGLAVPPPVDLPDDCESALAAARGELSRLKGVGDRIKECEAALREAREAAQEASTLVGRVRSRAASLRRTARGLNLYRQAVAKRFRLGR